jgi:hypothetical protein
MTKIPVALIACVAATTTVASQQPPLDLLLEKAGRYARGFQQDFETVIADETYVQRERVTRTQAGRERIINSARTINSEMVFMWLPEDRSWLLVRNVLKVDRKDVPDSKARLEHVIADATPGALLPRFNRLRDESARFNLGRIYRNLNDPMLPFQFVDPSYQPRFTFEIAGEDTIDGVAAWKLTFAEKAMPTVVTVDKHDSFSKGDIWLTSSGIVLRTHLAVENQLTSLRSTFVVTYGRDSKLAGWVPVRMEETYSQRPPASSSDRLATEISCVATYSNFRRFETSARIVTPK